MRSQGQRRAERLEERAMTPVERSFDAEFYTHFSALATERLTRLAGAFKGANTPSAHPDNLAKAIEDARHVLHNITGEARLLELADYATLVRRLSQPLGRIGTPLPELTSTRIDTLASLCAD